MKATPHTHKIQITRGYSDGTGQHIVRYGDTTIHVWNNPFFRQRRLDSAVRRAIRKHDRGSVKAQVKTDELAALNARYTATEADVPQWLSDHPDSALHRSVGPDGVNNPRGT